jgi:hypothetical protein
MSWFDPNKLSGTIGTIANKVQSIAEQLQEDDYVAIEKLKFQLQQTQKERDELRAQLQNPSRDASSAPKDEIVQLRQQMEVMQEKHRNREQELTGMLNNLKQRAAEKIKQLMAKNQELMNTTDGGKYQELEQMLKQKEDELLTTTRHWELRCAELEQQWVQEREFLGAEIEQIQIESARLVQEKEKQLQNLKKDMREHQVDRVVDGVQQERDRLLIEIEQLKIENDRLHEKVVLLEESRLDPQIVKAEATTSNLNQTQSPTPESGLDVLNRNLQEALLTIEERDVQIQVLQSELENLSLQKHEQGNGEIRPVINSDLLQTQLDEARFVLEERDLHIQMIQSELEQVNDQLQLLMDKNIVLEQAHEENQILHSKVNELNQKIQEQLVEMEQLSSQIPTQPMIPGASPDEIWEVERASLLEDQHRLELQLQTLTQEYQVLQNQLLNLEETRKLEKHKSTMDLNELKQKIVDLEHEAHLALEKENSLVRELQNKLEHIQDQQNHQLLEEFGTRESEWKAEKEDLEYNLRTLQEKQVELVQTIQKYDKDILELKQNQVTTELEGINTDLRVTISTLEEEVRQLKLNQSQEVNLQGMNWLK